MGGEQEAWLPVGWKIRVRVRTYGRKDKYYVNPSNGLKFSSKPEVLRYLTSSVKDRKSKELAKIDIKKTVAEQLPPGWIKKIQTKKKGNKMRRDLCYIDPVSGSHFRSIPQAIQYIESMDSGEAMPKSDAKGHVTVELGNHSISSSGEAKGQRSIDKKADTHLTHNRSVKPGMKTRASVAMKNMNILEDNHLEKREDDSLANGSSDKLQRENRMKRRADKIIEIKKLADSRAENKGSNRDQRSKSVAKVVGQTKVDMPVLEQIDKEDGFVAENLPNKSPQVVATERANGTRRRSMRLSNSKQNDNLTEDQSSQLGSKGSAEKSICLPERNDSKQVETDNNSTCEGRQRENLASQNKRKTPNGKCASDLPRRTSKRLARVKLEHSSPEVADTLSGESEVTARKKVGKDGPLDETPLIDDPTGKISNVSHENPANDQEIPISHDRKEDVKHSKNQESSLKGLLTDPCIEFAVKTLTGAIPIEEEVIKVGGDSPVTSLPLPNQASASSSSAHIWADPCFKFAVKMLTEDVSPSSYSFNQFDAANKKPCSMRQGVKDPPFPRGGSRR